MNKPALHYSSDVRVVRSREALRDALLGLLETTPLDNITTRDITSAAGIGYATFYRHYPTKEALLDDVATGQVEDLITVVFPSLVSENAKACALRLCHYVNEHRALWRTLLLGGAASTIKESFLQTARQLATGWQKEYSWLPIELGITLLVTSTVEFLAWWLDQEKPVPIDEAAEVFEGIINALTIPRT